jgi:hypothetical protein
MNRPLHRTLHAALVLALTSSAVALASPAPTPAAKGNVNGIDVSISAVGAQPFASAGNVSKDVGVYTGSIAGLDTANMFCAALGTTSCNPQSNNGPPSQLYGTAGGTYPTFPNIVVGSQLEMGDWIQMWESAPGRNGVTLGTSAGDRHPYIANNVYRTNAAGRLEQLSASWVKHSFSAASSNQTTIAGANGQSACGTGSCAAGGSDNELEANCSDTYGSGLNASPSYLGPRHEINPRGLMNSPGWHYQNSWFDNYTTSGTGTNLLQVLAPVASRNDGNRSFNAGTASAYQLMNIRRDEVTSGAAGALGTTGRIYFEGMYVVNGDNYKLNNVANRRFTSSYTSTASVPSSANFSFDGPHTWGPTILTWGDQKSQADPATDGQVFVCSRVVNNNNGTWRYEYNVYNLDLDRQIDTIEFPVPLPVNTTNFGFFQPRQYWPTYDNGAWTQSYDGAKKSIVWSAPAVTQPTDAQLAALNPPLPAGTVMNRNTIRWGTMYTFWFDADTGPRTGDSLVKLNPARAGSFSTMMTAEVRAPRHPADIGIQGGTAGDDGLLDNNDFIVFVNWFFNNDMQADIGVQGAVRGHDGVLDNNDFIVFVDLFFQN